MAGVGDRGPGQQRREEAGSGGEAGLDGYRSPRSIHAHLVPLPGQSMPFGQAQKRGSEAIPREYSGTQGGSPNTSNLSDTLSPCRMLIVTRICKTWSPWGSRGRTWFKWSLLTTSLDFLTRF